jgi:hypothetical protein
VTSDGRAGAGPGYNAATPMRTVFLIAVILATLLTGSSGAPVFAQDEDVDVSLLPRDAGTIEDVNSNSLQIYRFPISYNVRRLEEKPWGLRVYLPISLGTYELEAATDVGDFFDRMGSIAVVPGVEFLVPVGQRWVVKPFAEVGVGDDSASDTTHVLYSAGLRARAEFEPQPFHVMFGGAFRYRNNTTTQAVENWYSTVEVGADAQLPLGFSIGSRTAHGGLYAIMRHFSNLEFELITNGPINIEWNYEVGLSFSTDPALRLWKIKLPWIALGYRFGDSQTGVRLNFTFPF